MHDFGNRSRAMRKFYAVGAAIFVVAASVYAGLAYVAWHFIAKFW